MLSHRVWWSVCVLVFVVTTAHGAVCTFDEKAAFLTATGARGHTRGIWTRKGRARANEPRRKSSASI